MRIYVAGPYTKGDVAVNVRAAILAADELLNAGHLPYVPHLTHFWHLVTPHPYEHWTEMDLGWLEVCNAAVRLPGESSGADAEVEFANRREPRIPVFHSVREFLDVEFVHEPGAQPCPYCWGFEPGGGWSMENIDRFQPCGDGWRGFALAHDACVESATSYSDADGRAWRGELR